MERKNRLFENIRKTSALRQAWYKIYENGQRSNSPETLRLVNQFKQDEERNLCNLAQKLRKKDFDFGAVRGVAAKKKSGKSRPIVSAPVEARIVQRAILEELSDRKPIQKYFRVATSFGAIPKKSVPEAIKAAVIAIEGGATHYIKSDIADFFTKIPRAAVVQQISQNWNDPDFHVLLEKCTNLEIENLKELEKKHGTAFRDMFIFDQTGAPQGCCLSPLIGNILLYEFDIEMNSEDITCLRYLDDFILFGPSYAAVRKAYKKAQRLLGQHGLEAYDLETRKDKTGQGKTSDPFEFLGVEFRGTAIRPSVASKDRMIASTKEILGKVLKTDPHNHLNLVSALYLISNKIRGWGNQYKFCNDNRYMGSIDAEITQLLVPYFFKFTGEIKQFEQRKQRQLIGIWSLEDCKKDPIVFEDRGS
jgi:RNA-directed DNA polymerase